MAASSSSSSSSSPLLSSSCNLPEPGSPEFLAAGRAFRSAIAANHGVYLVTLPSSIVHQLRTIEAAATNFFALPTAVKKQFKSSSHHRTHGTAPETKDGLASSTAFSSVLHGGGSSAISDVGWMSRSDDRKQAVVIRPGVSMNVSSDTQPLHDAITDGELSFDRFVVSTFV